MGKGRGISSLVITNSSRIPEKTGIFHKYSLPYTADSSPEGNRPVHEAACSHMQRRAARQHSSRMTGIASWAKKPLSHTS